MIIYEILGGIVGATVTIVAIFGLPFFRKIIFKLFEAKQKIIKIILDKCKENKKDIKDFHFYQAYFNPDTNQIEKYEIFNLNLFTPHGA